MTIPFSKYQGTGNDFIIIDNRQDTFPKNDTKLIAHMCDRKFGIGADGLILLEQHSEVDFCMVYFNADGNESSMCGNGGRCIVAFAKALSLLTTSTTFMAIDGVHEAQINGDIVHLKMQDVSKIKATPEYTFLDTGSPHHVEVCKDVKQMNVATEGAAIRHSDLYGAQGSNINFVTPLSDAHYMVRTYERGVEDETLSCGTGVTAVALAMHYNKHTQAKEVELEVAGGSLKVRFETNGSGYSNIFLIGPAQFVFKGTWEC